MSIVDRVFESCLNQLQTVLSQEKPAIEAAGELIADAISRDQVITMFGSGHSTFIARDAYWRAGGLAPVVVIPDPLGGDAERLEGFAAIMLGHYRLEPGGVMVIISNSGINAFPVEMALEAKARGLKVVAITSRQHSSQVPPRHSSGKKLMDLADVVIDTHGVPGDASVALPESGLRVGATSTVVGAAIVQAIMSHAAESLEMRGVKPPVIVSSNLPEGDANNKILAEKYRDKMVRYEVPTVDAVLK